MLIHKRSISKEKNLTIVNMRDYIFEVFYKEILDPNYLKGYIAELLGVDSEPNSLNNKTILYLKYKLNKDLEYEEIKERLKIGL